MGGASHGQNATLATVRSLLDGVIRSTEGVKNGGKKMKKVQMWSNVRGGGWAGPGIRRPPVGYLAFNPFLSEGNKCEAARRLPLTLPSFPPFRSSPPHPPLWCVMMEVKVSPPAYQKLPGHNLILAKHSSVIFSFLKVVSGIFFRFQENKGWAELWVCCL